MHYDQPLSRILHHDLLECPSQTPVAEAAARMHVARCGSILVVDKREVQGIWTDRDALKLDIADPESLKQPIARVMVEKEGRGTDVTLHLKDGEEEFLSAWRLKSIIRKYSDHITLPIVMKQEKWDEEKKEQVLTDEDETVNQASALWTRAKNDITPEQYREFYKHVAHDFEDPLAWTHAKVEGKQEYTELLYLPSKAPFDMGNGSQNLDFIFPWSNNKIDKSIGSYYFG